MHAQCVHLLTYKQLSNKAVICTMIGVQALMNKFLRLLIFKFRPNINFIYFIENEIDLLMQDYAIPLRRPWTQANRNELKI